MREKKAKTTIEVQKKKEKKKQILQLTSKLFCCNELLHCESYKISVQSV